MSIILSIYGAEGTGKTSLAFTSPKPIDDYDLELGYERAIGRFNPAEIRRHIFERPGDEFKLPLLRKTGGGAVRLIPMGFATLRDAIVVAFNKFCKGDCSTIVFDTHTILWEYVWKAYQEQEEIGSMMPTDYGIPNDIMAGFIHYARGTNKNMVLIHHEKDVYVSIADAKGNTVSRTTGEKVADGFKHTGDLADIVVRIVKEPLVPQSQSGKPMPNQPKKMTPIAIIEKPDIGMTDEQKRVINPTWDSILKRIAEVKK